LTAALLAAIVADVAIRRIAWNLGMARVAADAAASRIRGFTLVRQAQPAQSLEALGRVRREVRDEMSRQVSEPGVVSGSASEPARPNAAASGKPAPGGKEKSPDSAAAAGDKSSMSSLLAAKRRAQEQIRRDQEDKEQ
jgi:hypothetical protein